MQGSLSKSPINKLADLIIDYAVKMCASDIHFEPQQDYLQIRFRIDGVLLLVYKSATTNSNSIDIVFKAHGGYGYFRKEITARWKVFYTLKKRLDIRVSVIPVLFGEENCHASFI